MKLTQISVTIGRTVNLGNYNSSRIEVGATADLDLDDDPDTAYRTLYATVKVKIDKAAAALLKEIP